MNIITTVFVLAGLVAASPGKCEAVGLDIQKMSFDEMAGAHFPAFLEAARSPGQNMIVPAAGIARPDGPAARLEPVQQSEAEIKRCPPGAAALGSPPDPDIYTYVGFRNVRSDGSTCAAQPGGGIYYREPAEKDLVFHAGPEGDEQASYSYHLAAREYIIRRNFFFRTQLDGARLFYSYDTRQYTGKQVPETVELEFANRADYPLLPWEPAETFRLRYGLAAGADLAPGQYANYEYGLRSTAGLTSEGDLLTRFDIKVLRKKRLTPPESGAVTLALVNGGNTLFLDVRDSRAKYYRNEKLGLRVSLWRNVFLWPDGVAYEMELDLPAASQILIDLSDPKWDKFKKEAIAAGREYYADWSFRRADSAISTGEWIDKGRTDRISVGGKPALIP